MRIRDKTDFSITDDYKYYKKRVSNPVEYKVFSNIIKEFHQAVSEAIIYENFNFKLPRRLGILRVKRFKIKIKLLPNGKVDTTKLSPDWQATKKLWARDPEAREKKQLVLHLNRHTEGYTYKFYWHKGSCNVKNHTAYSFKMNRFTTRQLAQLLKDPNRIIDFYE